MNLSASNNALKQNSLKICFLCCSSVFNGNYFHVGHIYTNWKSDLVHWFLKLFWFWDPAPTSLDWTISMSFWLGCSSAAEEGQRALAHPHSLVQFLGSFINRTAEQCFLSPNSITAYLEENLWMTASHTHADTKLCDSVQRKTSYSHYNIWPILVQQTNIKVSGPFSENGDNNRCLSNKSVEWVRWFFIMSRRIWTKQGFGQVNVRSTQDIYYSLSEFGRDLRVGLHRVSKWYLSTYQYQKHLAKVCVRLIL